MRITNILLSVFLLLTFFYSCAQPKNTGVTLIQAKEYQTKLETLKDKQLIDVRTPGEAAEGYIAGAVNIDFNDEGFEKNVLALDKNKPTFVYCKAGGRSKEAAEKLIKLGFRQVYDLKGGIMSWINNKLPLQKVNEETAATKGVSGLSMEVFNKMANSHHIIIVDFFAVWCGPCKRLSPMLAQIEKEYGDKIKVVKVDVDQNPNVANYFQIESIPLLYFYKDGKLSNQIMGLPDKQNLVAAVDALLK